MDTLIGTDGDIIRDISGRPALAQGDEETYGALYCLLMMRKGSDIYGRELGSRIWQLDPRSDDYIERVRAEARDALGVIRQAEVTDVVSDGENLTVSIVHKGKLYNVKLPVSGGDENGSNL